MSQPASDPWSVEITSRGRSGSVEYQEPAGRISFYWEFASGETLAVICFEALAEWNARQPWAVGRRREILERVAGEVLRQKAPAGRADIDEPGGCIFIREPIA